MDSFALIGRLNPFLARNRKKNRNFERGSEQTDPMNRSKARLGGFLTGRRESNRPGRISSPLRSAARWEAAARDATGEAEGEGGGGGDAEDWPRDGGVGGGGGDARGRGGNHKTLAAGDK